MMGFENVKTHKKMTENEKKRRKKTYIYVYVYIQKLKDYIYMHGTRAL